MTDTSKENTREIVLDILLETDSQKEFSHRVIRNVLNKYDYLKGQEKAFIKRLAEGTLERRIELDYILNQVSSVPVGKMKPLIRSLLRMGTYQILYMDSVPDSAACNEAVKLAGKRRFRNLKGFVNGVLRKVASEKDCLPYPDREKDIRAYLSVRYSMPEWIVDMWLNTYGEPQTEKLLEGLLDARPVTIRFASRVPEEKRQRLISSMESMGMETLPHPYLPYACLLKGAEGIAALPGYEEGAFTVQDVSSMLAVEAAGIKQGDFVLDICAAPGGKAMLAAEKAGACGRVEARDVSELKTVLIEENIQRMALKNVAVKVWDARLKDPAMEKKADVVLADVPCTGLGVIGRKPDIKYNVTRESMDSIVSLQKEILSASAGYVKEGGILLYSTCTVNRAENETMVQWICKEFPFIVEDAAPFLPIELREGIAGQEGIQLLPGIHESDGFFFARLRRVGKEYAE